MTMLDKKTLLNLLPFYDKKGNLQTCKVTTFETEIRDEITGIENAISFNEKNAHNYTYLILRFMHSPIQAVCF